MPIERIIIAASILFCCVSCEIFDPKEEIPSYISVQDISLTTYYPDEGSDSEDITDVWLYIDDKLIGVHELPVEFPVLQAGAKSVTVYPGIQQSGFVAQREIYPFYEPYQTSLTLYRDSTVQFTPQFSYKDNTNFLWIEDFESSNISMDSSYSSLGTVKKNTNGAFEGNASGHIQVTPEKYYTEVYSSEKVNLPRVGFAVYLEMNFKCDTKFEVSLRSTLPDQTIETYPVLGLNATEGRWKKIYIDLTDAAGEMQQAEGHQVLMQAELQDGRATGNIYLDNLKLLTE